MRVLIPLCLLLIGCSTCDSLFCFGEKARREANRKRFEEMITEAEMEKVSDRVVELRRLFHQSNTNTVKTP